MLCDGQEEQNRGKPNWEHLNDELHVLLTVEDTENRAQLKMQRAVEEVKKLLIPVSLNIESNLMKHCLNSRIPLVGSEIWQLESASFVLPTK